MLDQIKRDRRTSTNTSMRALALAAVAAGTVLLGSPKVAHAEEVTPDGKGIAGGALLGAELVVFVEALAGVRSGTLHGTNAGATTWHGFAYAIVENLGGDPATVMPTDSAQFVRPARRPANSVLAHDGWARLGLAPMRPWRAALDDAMAEGVFT